MSSAPEFLSVNAYAKRRGCDEKAVRKAILDGRLSRCVTRDTNGRAWVRPDVADDEWRENTLRSSNHDLAEASIDDDGLSARDRYNLARARKEHYAAEKARLDYDERRGALLQASTVRRDWFAATRILRDSLLAIPARVEPQLVAETDGAAVRALLEEELVASLTDVVQAFETTHGLVEDVELEDREPILIRSAGVALEAGLYREPILIRSAGVALEAGLS